MGGVVVVENLRRRRNAVQPSECVKSQDIDPVRTADETQAALRVFHAVDTLVHDFVRCKSDVEETEHHGVRAVTLDRHLARVVPPSR